MHNGGQFHAPPASLSPLTAEQEAAVGLEKEKNLLFPLRAAA
jgi:hypothetical protein